MLENLLQADKVQDVGIVGRDKNPDRFIEPATNLNQFRKLTTLSYKPIKTLSKMRLQSKEFIQPLRPFSRHSGLRLLLAG